MNPKSIWVYEWDVLIAAPITCNLTIPLKRQPPRAQILNHAQLESCSLLFLVPPLEYATQVSVA